MAIVLFIAVIAIANCVSAANLSSLVSEEKANVSTDGSVKTYKLVNNKFEAGTDIVIRESNIKLDLGSETVGKITVYGQNVRIKGASTIEALEVAASGELVREKDDVSVDPAAAEGVVNKGTLIMENGRSYKAVKNSGTLVVEEGARVDELTMEAGTATIDGTVTIKAMKAGRVEAGKNAKLTVSENAVEDGVIISKVQFTGYANAAKDSEKYVFVRTTSDEEEKAWYLIPTTELQIAVQFEDVETGDIVTNLTAGHDYKVTAKVVYNGVEVTKNAWNTFKYTSKNTDILMAVTDEAEQFRALKDGKAELEVVTGSGDAEVKRTINVTVGEVKNDEPDQEPEGNQPSENKGELDSTPKTGDYIEMAAAILVVDKGERNEKNIKINNGNSIIYSCNSYSKLCKCSNSKFRRH